MIYDTIIVGGGTAGLTAALYLRRAGRSVMLFEKENFGGQILYAQKVDNYPGLPGVSGGAFIDALLSQAEDAGVEYSLEETLRVGKSESGFTVNTDSGEYACRSVIVASGMVHKKLGLSDEDTLIGHGVSYCATCDGAFFRDQTVAVCGGGNSALSEALHLSTLCREVYLIHRRDTFRAEEAVVKSALARPNISPVYDSVITDLKSQNDTLTAVTLKNVKTSAETTLPLSGLFVSVGKLPNTEAFQGILSLDSEGYIVAGEDTKTSVPGIFAAGDCRTKAVRQLTTASADGAVAAAAVNHYLTTAR